jgi:type IV pilus assembly protein PilP
MTLKVSFALVAAATALLSGCAGGNDEELREWMTELRASIKPRITPLIEPKKFQPQTYVMDAGFEPFNSTKLTLALRKESNQVGMNAALIAPEMARRKEPLEAYPLDSVMMVGSLDKRGSPAALLKVDKLLYQVRIGNYLGQNYGKITNITENAVHLREIVQDATGDWVERSTLLELQEGKK